ncbi:outer membrane lipoprotein carrier protein LolA [Tamlana sp. 2201CG12-4]|uniref:outer membrane lipoprotein carrier protein LolA n=1 Tax=Tamlana sp. 2201CG12-4 TaxID=3112582 RepID=UPI002DB64F47|nr:outer membrane lipoprotein carrier protein LolA [Tamlana sp. 2201CG12-4]MEC3906103.1 outer membrane lipoprotein carrier protein LolA [Tamlana sp. 2201CG12-4]
MRNIIIILLFSISCQNVFSQKSLNANEIKTFKENVITLDKNTKTIVSDFTQYKHLSFLNNDIETIGKLVFKTPNVVKWEYTSPYQYSIIFKDDTLLINDEGDKSNIDIGSNKMFKSLNNIITNSVKGNMFNDDEFVISYFKSDGNYLVKFVPKDESMRKFIAVLELVFSQKTTDVIEVKMIEPSNDYTKIIFKNKTRNTTVNDEIFNN